MPDQPTPYRRVQVRTTDELVSYLVVAADDELADELRVRAASSRLLSVTFHDPEETTVFFGPSVASVAVEVVDAPERESERAAAAKHSVSFRWEPISG